MGGRSSDTSFRVKGIRVDYEDNDFLQHIEACLKDDPLASPKRWFHKIKVVPQPSRAWKARHVLALQWGGQTATVSCSTRFCKSSLMAKTLDIAESLSPNDQPATADDHFEGLTVLYTPEDPQLE